MHMQKNKQPVAVYKLDSLPYPFAGRMLLLFLFLLPAILGYMAFKQLASGDWLGILWLGAAIFGFSRNMWFVHQEVIGNRLFVFDIGLGFQYYGIYAFAYWDELNQFGWKKSGPGASALWGIWVDETLSKSVSSCSKIFVYRKQIQVDDFIPLHYWASMLHNFDGSVDLERFKKTSLGSDLYYYAPHLFDEVDADKPKFTPVIEEFAA